MRDKNFLDSEVDTKLSQFDNLFIETAQKTKSYWTWVETVVTRNKLKAVPSQFPLELLTPDEMRTMMREIKDELLAKSSESSLGDAVIRAAGDNVQEIADSGKHDTNPDKVKIIIE